MKAYGGEKKVLALLKQQGMNMELLKRSIRGQTLSQKAIAVVTKSATVSDADVQAYWDAHKSEFLKDKKTNTFAKAKATIGQTLLSAKQQQLWNAWLDKRVKEIGVVVRRRLRPRRAQRLRVGLAGGRRLIRPERTP